MREYIVVTGWAWANETGCGISYSADHTRFESRDEAIRHGFTMDRSDDFNIGVIDDGKLVSLDWMHELVDDNPETLAEISEELGLR